MRAGFKGLLLATLCGGSLALAQTGPYAGQEQRSIKSLSEQEVSGLLSGAGAGFARAAELNGYPVRCTFWSTPIAWR